jgi:hypothetical protein
MKDGEETEKLLQETDRERQKAAAEKLKPNPVLDRRIPWQRKIRDVIEATGISVFSMLAYFNFLYCVYK